MSPHLYNERKGGPAAFQNCKAQATNSFNNNWFIKNFSLVSALRDPTPFVQTTGEVLMVKGAGTALAYGTGGAFKAVGTAFVNAGEPIRGGSYLFTGEAIQGLTLSGVKALGVAGTAATMGATGADLGYNLNASYACRGYLSTD